MKDKIRKKYLNIRSNISNKQAKDEKIFNLVINHPIIKNKKNILIYVSYNGEVDTINLIKYFLKSKLVAVPKIENGEMNFYYINSLNDLKKGYSNILEPITNNKVLSLDGCVVITPGVCFSLDGSRLGYGKGFYDHFFSKYSVYKIGLCYSECLFNELDHYLFDFDQKVDEVIYD